MRHLCRHDLQTAVKGEINCLDTGDFGPVTIIKSITIDCAGLFATVLNQNPMISAITVNVANGEVVLRNLDINGAGAGVAGIQILQAASVHIENVSIHGNLSSGIELVPNAAPPTGTTKLSLLRVASRSNGQHGLLVAPAVGTASVAVFDSSFVGNTLNGNKATDFSFVAVSNSLLSSNTSHGVVALTTLGGTARIALDHVICSSNGNAGLIANGAGAAFYLTNVLTTDNSYGLFPAIAGGTYFSFGNNHSTANVNGDGGPVSGLMSY